MIQVNSTIRYEDAGSALAAAAHHHGASILAVTDLGRLLDSEHGPGHDVQVFTVCHTEIYSALLAADVRFAALLPCRIAAIREADGVALESLSPKEHCQSIQRPDLDGLATPLENLLRQVMDGAAHPTPRATAAAQGKDSGSTGATEWQMNMQGVIGQRIDRRSTRVEDVAGTGHLDTPGG